MTLLAILIIGIYFTATVLYKYIFRISITEAITYTTLGMFVTFALKLASGMILYGEEIVGYDAIPWLILTYIVLAGPIYQKQKKSIRKKAKKC